MRLVFLLIGLATRWWQNFNSPNGWWLLPAAVAAVWIWWRLGRLICGLISAGNFFLPYLV